MSKLNVEQIEIDVNRYPDQTNITVTVTLENGNEYIIQTDAVGDHSVMAGCQSWLNGDGEFEVCGNEEFNAVVIVAEKQAHNSHRRMKEGEEI